MIRRWRESVSYDRRVYATLPEHWNVRRGPSDAGLRAVALKIDICAGTLKGKGLLATANESTGTSERSRNVRTRAFSQLREGVGQGQFVPVCTYARTC